MPGSFLSAECIPWSFFYMGFILSPCLSWQRVLIYLMPGNPQTRYSGMQTFSSEAETSDLALWQVKIKSWYVRWLPSVEGCWSFICSAPRQVYTQVWVLCIGLPESRWQSENRYEPTSAHAEDSTHSVGLQDLETICYSLHAVVTCPPGFMG